ncbi:MAG TPA: GerMN domain-containing protein [Actinomycetota bacterium]|nr:GerMN domain-containing protein [Actinomycetota bacterium]
MTPEDKMRDLIGRAATTESASEKEWTTFLIRANRSVVIRRGVIAVGLVVLVIGAFVVPNLVNDGVRTPQPQPPAGSDSPEDVETAEPSPTPDKVVTYPYPSGDTEGSVVQIWFVETIKNKEMLTSTYRDVGDTPAVARAAMESLLAGPQGPEGETGVTTTIPSGTSLLGLTIDDGVATVDLSTEFDETGLGTCCEHFPLAQVVYTLTSFDTVDEVVFHIEGETVESYGSHGLVIEQPQTRDDYSESAPPIVVNFPFLGQNVGTTFTLVGSANVFEATVSYRIVGDGGSVLKEGFTTATCGTGCVGDYSEKVTLLVKAETEAVLEVFESSAEDGSPLHKVEIPITIVP